MIDRPIMFYIEQERARCLALAKKLARGADAGLLAFCLENSYSVSEIPTARKRFNDQGGDNIDDLF